jgi:hypothetical protein
MTFPKARLAVSAVLFLSWIGFLLYLVVTDRSVVLSRPQFAIAQLVVVADVKTGARSESLDPRITILEVPWAANSADRKFVDQAIEIPELASFEQEHGNVGPGKYILALQRRSGDIFEIAPLPRDAEPWNAKHITLEGNSLFSRRTARRLAVQAADQLEVEWKAAGLKVEQMAAEKLRIYRLDSSTRSQLEQIVRARTGQ